MTKVLLIDDSDALKKYLIKSLSGTATVLSANTDDSLLELACNFKPDIIVMDMMLKGQDPIQILTTLRSTGKNPLILATTDTVTDFVRARVQNLGVSYVLCRPFKQSLLLERLMELIRFSADAGTSWVSDEDITRNILFTLGMQENRSGYQCLYKALQEMYANPNISMTKELYPAVAKACGGSAKGVERAIRCTVHKAFDNRDKALWRIYFPAGDHAVEKCPTNGELISRLASCVKKEKKIV